MKKHRSKPSLFRRRYLINRPMQLAYSGFLVLAVALGMIITWLVTYYTIWSLVLNRIPQNAQLPRILLDINLRLFWMLVIPGFIFLVLVGWGGIFLLHRIAGPVYRIHNTMIDMTQGLWPESVRVRSQDFLKDVVEEFNLLITVEEARYAQLATSIKKTAELLIQLEGKSAADSQKLIASRETLNEALGLIDTILPKSDSGDNG